MIDATENRTYRFSSLTTKNEHERDLSVFGMKASRCVFVDPSILKLEKGFMCDKYCIQKVYCIRVSGLRFGFLHTWFEFSIIHFLLFPEEYNQHNLSPGPRDASRELT